MFYVTLETLYTSHNIKHHLPGTTAREYMIYDIMIVYDILQAEYMGQRFWSALVQPSTASQNHWLLQDKDILSHI